MAHQEKRIEWCLAIHPSSPSTYTPYTPSQHHPSHSSYSSDKYSLIQNHTQAARLRKRHLWQQEYVLLAVFVEYLFFADFLLFSLDPIIYKIMEKVNKVSVQVSKCYRCVTFLVSVLVVILSLASLLSLQLSQPQNYILAIHFIILAVTLFLSEFDVQVIHRNLQWVSTRTGKGTFLLFLGTIMISDNVVQIIACAICIVVGAIYIYMGYQENKEDKYIDNADQNVNGAQVDVNYKQGQVPEIV